MELMLQNMCIDQATNMLLMGYWSQCTKDCNPFAFLPCGVVDNILRSIIRYGKTLSIQCVYPLLISNRLSEVEITPDVYIDMRQFVEILMCLSTNANQLKKLVLQNKYPEYRWNEKEAYVESAHAIGNLLILARNIKTLEVTVPFDLTYLQHVPELEHLQLNFEPRNPLYDMIPYVNGAYKINRALHYFAVSSQIKFPAKELAFILQHCPELKRLGNDISESLEFCHTDELIMGELSERYKLEKIKLGYYASCSASVYSVNIATITCPHVIKLDICLITDEAVAAICDFKNLENLAITWNSQFSTGNFQLGLKSVVEKVGAKLKRFKIDNFDSIDLAHIGHCCPNLARLEIKYVSATTSGNMPCFERLGYLHLEGKHQSTISKQALLQLLSRCRNITYLRLNNISCFDDAFVRKMLSLNCWPKLVTAIVCNCDVSKAMEKLLLQHFPCSQILLFRQPLLFLPRLILTKKKLTPPPLLFCDVCQFLAHSALVCHANSNVECDVLIRDNSSHMSLKELSTPPCTLQELKTVLVQEWQLLPSLCCIRSSD